MPVTAKLSRRFYEKLGEDVANELVDWFNSVDATYKADLREFNELNFARFDAKVEERFARADARLEQRLAALEAKISSSHNRLVVWMFGFWTGNMLALAGFVYVMLKSR